VLPRRICVREVAGLEYGSGEQGDWAGTARCEVGSSGLGVVVGSSSCQEKCTADPLSTIEAVVRLPGIRLQWVGDGYDFGWRGRGGHVLEHQDGPLSSCCGAERRREGVQIV
jgi:hypothetical protein